MLRRAPALERRRARPSSSAAAPRRSASQHHRACWSPVGDGVVDDRRKSSGGTRARTRVDARWWRGSRRSSQPVRPGEAPARRSDARSRSAPFTALGIAPRSGGPIRIRIRIAWRQATAAAPRIATRPLASRASCEPHRPSALLLVGLLAVAARRRARGPPSRSTCPGTTAAPPRRPADHDRCPARRTDQRPHAAATTAPTADGRPDAAGTATTLGAVRREAALECGTLTVPLDYADPTKGTIDLFLKRRPASGTDRIGSLLVNPGGPGVAGTCSSSRPASLHRGPAATASTSSAGTRGAPAGRARSTASTISTRSSASTRRPTRRTRSRRSSTRPRSSTPRCEARSGQLLPYVSTQDTARDMDRSARRWARTRSATSASPTAASSGATYATMFPDTCGPVLDGAADPNAATPTSHQPAIVGLERGLDSVMDDCAGNPKCAFHHDGDPDAAYDRSCRSWPPTRPVRPTGDRRSGRASPSTASISSLYDQEQWPACIDALAAAENGRRLGMLALYDQYWNRRPDGTWTERVRGPHRHQLPRRPRAPTDEELATLAEEMAELALALGGGGRGRTRASSGLRTRRRAARDHEHRPTAPAARAGQRRRPSDADRVHSGHGGRGASAACS